MAPIKNPGELTIRDGRIFFRNFAGRESQYNAPGNRNFHVELDADVAKQMAEDGWNVKFPEPKAGYEDEVRQPHIEVTVSYKHRPPRIHLISWRGNPAQQVRTLLPEELLELLDYADIESVDLTVNPYVWGPIRGESGIKAYCKTMFVKIKRDELEAAYADVPEIDFNGAPLQIEGGDPMLQLEAEPMLEAEVIEDVEEEA